MHHRNLRPELGRLCYMIPEVPYYAKVFRIAGGVLDPPGCLGLRQTPPTKRRIRNLGGRRGVGVLLGEELLLQFFNVKQRGEENPKKERS